MTDDRELLTRVRAFYDNGLRVIRDAVGWVRERHHPSFHPEQGEMNNVGDVIETALILGNYFGDTYFEDAERYSTFTVTAVAGAGLELHGRGSRRR